MRGEQGLAHPGIGAMQRQGQRRLDGLLWQALEDTPVAYRRKHEVFVAYAPIGAQNVYRLEHVVQVVRRLAHPHENHFLHCPDAPRQRDLGDDFRTAELAQQPALARHAKDTANRTSDLARNAQSITRQQDALHHLPIGQGDEQPRRAIRSGVLRTHPREAIQRLLDPWQAIADRQREEIFTALMACAGIQRLPVEPGTGQPSDMDRLGAEFGKLLVDIVDAHRARILAKRPGWVCSVLAVNR